MSGYLGDLSEKQERALAQFKINLKDVLEDKYDDRLLLQFLRARNFDLKKSEAMFRSYLQFRSEYPPEELVRSDYDPPEIIKKYGRIPFLGFDKEGSPVRWFPCGTYDLRGLQNSLGIHDAKRHLVHCLAVDSVATKQYNAKYDRDVEGRSFIFDLANLKFTQLFHKPVLEWLIGLLHMYEANYPENLKVAHVINLPYFFSLIWSIVKTVAAEETVKKIRIYSPDELPDALLESIDADVLPACYGGTRIDDNGDTYCSSMVNVPGPIPGKFYLKNQNRLRRDSDDVRHLLLRRRSREEMQVRVDEPGWTIVWNVECPDQELNLGLFYKGDEEISNNNNNKNCMEEVVPFSRFGGNLGPASGSFINKKPGKYVLVFDNTFSIFRSKDVLCKIDTLPPTMTSNENDIINSSIEY